MRTPLTAWALLLAMTAGCVGVSAASTADQAAERDEERTVSDLLAGARGLTAHEGFKLAAHLGGDTVYVVPAMKEGYAFVGSAVGVAMSEGLVARSELREGVWWLPNGGVFVLAPDSQPINLEPGSVMLVGKEALDDALTASDTASTTCGPGRYACCGTNANGLVQAACIRDGELPDPGAHPNHPTSCRAGGEGATSCTFSNDSLIALSF